MTDTIRRAGRSLRQAKARTLLTSLAIAVGAFTLTLALAAGEGSRQYADKLISSNVDPKALFIVKDKTLFGEGGQSNTGLREYDPDVIIGQNGPSDQAIKQLTQKDVDALLARDDLEEVQPTYQVSARYVTFAGNEKKYTASIAVYNPDIRSETAAGSIPALGQKLGDQDIIIPESFTETLKATPQSLIGKQLTLTLAKPTKAPTSEEISQIIATKGLAGLSELSQIETKDETFTIRGVAKQSPTALATGSSVQIPATKAKEFAEYSTQGTDNYQKYLGVTAKAKGDNKPADVKASLAKAGYPAQTAKDLQNLLFTIVTILQGIVAGFGLLALIASVFGIINTQYISVLERTKQIGLMKALGMRGRDVSRLFRYEAAWIGFLGGVLGAGTAWVAGSALNPWITEKLDLGAGNSLLVFQAIPVIALILALMLIAVIAGYFPARKAAKLDPIEALRTE